MSDDIEKIPGSSTAPKPVDEAEESFKPKTLKFWVIQISLLLALFHVALDRTIIGTALPQITQEFNSLGDIGWTFLWSILVFEIGSLIWGIAPNTGAFIIGRGIAGLGGAGVFTGVMVVMLPLLPLRK
ncbi:hypothetical protein DL771_012354 [Monosporascus sp. 5C6A]|nr:hypothetical protein DL771_012354 [Monosporascus sp. 5C6A]